MVEDYPIEPAMHAELVIRHAQELFLLELFLILKGGNNGAYHHTTERGF
jgi:hypothetical protein